MKEGMNECLMIPPHNGYFMSDNGIHMNIMLKN